MSGTSLNLYITGMNCIRCGTSHPIADYFEGCPACLAEGFPVSVAPHYEKVPHTYDRDHPEAWLAYPGGPFLGEGRTPLVALPKLAEEIGIRALFAKNESANPTGSHKDRMSALFVRRAKEIGATTVSAASSGNAGVSLAAYAARAGLRCVVVTTPKMSGNWRRAVEMHGAELIATATPEERWELIRRKAVAGEWYPATNYLTPPVGSNPFGVDGYRAIALELYGQCDADARPTDIIVPTARGDILWGIARGYLDLKKAGLVPTVPKVHAVEPFPRIARVFDGADLRGDFPGESKMASIGGSTVTYQALEALRLTGGRIATVDEAAVISDQRKLAQAGLYAELSSVAALSGVRRLVRQRTVSSEAHVVLVVTAHGYKEDAPYDHPLPIVSVEGGHSITRSRHGERAKLTDLTAYTHY
ncbi:Pyridoxal-5'-phosphate-dependent protein beta subunit (plasmid) [Cupriavidus taiwanensis]|nr:pyridoxal-phosphate dependent enzyme [Cupriavidus taiwanensis]SOZ70939.1 Pyridoxal-5'-phosphate-dependent protein beta subunit [Cupriavidus taiwanensis]SOZ72130.1 Pyridoxal-5'-phosphate-dependent protein beta subunit [Cupriavidus taiwanensis]SOZ74427.1 Pyridoxal-5'-phosphate-dependent protein beta subunit [Cupriavidus taiwanensis]SPA03332.1 Pyridoxal-5'-phosphate-dependent protein beta subunit [Cupriavidus taiwanensis]SPA57275.1 Pyridoxal-5'-phosphate-dependent protein beta subunit [Cupriav